MYMIVLCCSVQFLAKQVCTIKENRPEVGTVKMIWRDRNDDEIIIDGTVEYREAAKVCKEDRTTLVYDPTHAPYLYIYVLNDKYAYRRLIKRADKIVVVSNTHKYLILMAIILNKRLNYALTHVCRTNTPLQWAIIMIACVTVIIE